MSSNAVRDSAQLAIAIYGESLAARGVVAVLGDASTGLGALFAELGARTVHVLDPDPHRARFEADRAARGVLVRPFGRDPLPLRGLDLVVVPDLGIFENPAGILEQVAMMAGDGGAALVAAANRDAALPAGSRARAFDYYELFDLVARQFECVRMIAALPFEGVTLAELGQEDDETPEVSVDTQLADEQRQPDAFVALASQRDVRLDPYAIVELLPSAPAGAEVEIAASSLADAEARVDALEVEIEGLRERASESRQAVEAVAVLERALEERSAVIAQLETALDEQTRRTGRLSSELDEARGAAEARRLVAAQVEEMARRADRAESAAAALEAELAGRAGDAEQARLEEALQERAHAVKSLEVELARRERMIRELVERLDDAAASGRGPGPAPVIDGRQDGQDEEIARLRDKLDTMALDLARREGDAQAAAWSIEELERRLAQATQPSANAADAAIDRKLGAALDELDALRHALVQEHEARVRAESGDELAGARAEIHRQSVLLEQMTRELESQGERG
jgi:hypothetical protein